MDGHGQQAVVKATRRAASIQKVDTGEFDRVARWRVSYKHVKWRERSRTIMTAALLRFFCSF